MPKQILDSLFQFIHRKVNDIAHQLVRFGLYNVDNFIWFEVSPDFIQDTLLCHSLSRNQAFYSRVTILHFINKISLVLSKFSKKNKHDMRKW